MTPHPDMTATTQTTTRHAPRRQPDVTWPPGQLPDRGTVVLLASTAETGDLRERHRKPV